MAKTLAKLPFLAFWTPFAPEKLKSLQKVLWTNDNRQISLYKNSNSGVY